MVKSICKGGERKTRERVKSIGMIAVLMLACISLPTSIISILRPVETNITENNYYYNTTIIEQYNTTIIEQYNTTTIINNTYLLPEPEFIIDRSKSVEFYNITFNTQYEYISITYEMGTDEIYEWIRIGGWAINKLFVPVEWKDAFLETFVAPNRYWINANEGNWTPPYLWNWTLIIWTTSTEILNNFTYYDAIRTVF